MDDNGDGGDAQMPLGPAIGPVYEQWESALEKLKILHYETGYCGKGRKQFHRVHFVFPGANPGVQFDEFVDLCAWLCTIISRDEIFKRDQYDDPNTVVNKLLLALRGLSFDLSFPSQKLKTAHGEHTCAVLDFLCDKALQARKFKWGTPQYSSSGGDDTEMLGMDDEQDGTGGKKEKGKVRHFSVAAGAAHAASYFYIFFIFCLHAFAHIHSSLLTFDLQSYHNPHLH